MAIMQGQLTRIDDRVDFVYRSMKLQADVAANLDELNNSITTLAGQVAEINARAQMLSDKMNKIEHGDSGKRALDNVRAVNIRLEKLNFRVESLSNELVAFARLMEKRSGISRRAHKREVESVSRRSKENDQAPAKPKAAEVKETVEPGQLYQRAYNSYLRGVYDKAIGGFSEYVKRYPNTELSDNAAYWMGESYMEKADYKEAVAAFDNMVENYPGSNKAPSAMLKSAEAMDKMGDQAGAEVRLKLVIERYPTSREALTARQRIANSPDGNKKEER